MSSAHQRARLAEALTGPVAELGLDLEGLDLSAAGKRSVLRVAVDRDGGATMDDIAEATSLLSRVLDEGELMGERAYTLEVSSPGVDRPLTLARHWRRNLGRLVEVSFADADAERVIGRISAADEDGATLAVAEGPAAGEHRVRFADVATAKIQVEFRRPEEE